VAALLSLIGALLAAAALLVVPGLSGHPAQTSPSGVAVSLDWLHVASASTWTGGLLALLLVAWRSRSRRTTLARIVPRFSRVAFVSVVLLVTTGVIAAILHLPTLSSLWQTSYGRTILVKAGLLTLAALLGAVNFTRTSPRLTAAAERNDVAHGEAAVSLLRRVVSGEFALLTATVLAAVILTSLPPPPKALADVGQVSAHVGPGPVTTRVQHGSTSVTIRVAPNRAATPNTFTVGLTESGKPVRGAEVIARFLMLDMEMGQLTYTMPETAPGIYQRSAPALVMVGHWGIAFEIHVPGQAPFTVTVIDKAGG
jgi:copper transport protein